MRPLRWIEGLLLVIGFICLGVVGWQYGSTWIDQSYANYQLEEEMRGGEASLSGYARYLFGREDKPLRTESESPVADEPQPDVPTRPDLKRGETLGRLEIPRLVVSGVVRHGADADTLKRAVGHVPDTALPGEAGNVGLAAHRDTFFRNLKDVKIGDIVDIITPAGTYHYKVESTKIVMPKNVEVLDPTPDPSLTLVTCYPFNYVGSAPKRFIVRAKQVGGPEVAGTRNTKNRARRDSRSRNGA